MALEELKGFDDPSPELEQYTTPTSLASALLDFASSHGDVDDKDMLDLGCGTGVLTVGAALLGGSAVGVDIDGGALAKARTNAERAGVEGGDGFVRADVSRLPVVDKSFDTVVMNPPFGAQKRGADRPFLRAAERVADVSYSIHNAGSLGFVEDFIGGEVTHAFETTVELDRRFEFHEEESREIKVEVYRTVF